MCFFENFFLSPFHPLASFYLLPFFLLFAFLPSPCSACLCCQQPSHTVLTLVRLRNPIVETSPLQIAAHLVISHRPYSHNHHRVGSRLSRQLQFNASFFSSTPNTLLANINWWFRNVDSSASTGHLSCKPAFARQSWGRPARERTKLL